MELHLSTPEAVFLAHELAGRIGKPEEEIKAALLDILQPMLPVIKNGHAVIGAEDRNESRREPATPAPAKSPAVQKEASEEEIREIIRHFASLPVYDARSSDEILGYDENGLPT